MNIKLSTYKVFAIVALFFSSCSDMMNNAIDTDKIEPIEVSYKVSAATGFIEKGANVIPDPNFSTQGVEVVFTNNNTGAIVKGFIDEDCIVTVSLVPGVYSVSVTGTTKHEGSEYYLNGNVSSLSFLRSVSKVEAIASGSGMIIRPAKVSSLCFSEIYYCGVASYYFRDQTYQIYNNGEETVYLDGICFAQLEPNIATATPPTWPDEDGTDNYVYGKMIWQFPGSGTDYPLAPGESVVVVQEARDHTKNNPNSYDNSMADWECNTGNVTRDNAAVDNMPYIFYAGYLNTMQWLTSVFGGAFVLYQGDADNLLNKSYYEDPSHLQAPVNESTRYAKIPAGMILDGIELLTNMDAMNMKRIPGFIDAGGTSVGATYCGKSVSRKVIGTRTDGTPIYSDTNNSTYDFQINDHPVIRRDSQKAPSWSKAYNK